MVADSEVIDLYQKNAKLWDELRGVDLIERQWLDRFLSTIATPNPNIFDLGCGTGKPVASYLIGRGCRITGVDGSSALIGRAREAFPAHIWITADMRGLPPLKRFDGIIAWHSVFHLTPDEQRRMFQVFDHLCDHGAALVFTSGTTHSDALGSFAGQPLYHGSLDSAEYRALLHSHGFDVIQHTEHDSTCGDATVWLARKTR